MAVSADGDLETWQASRFMRRTFRVTAVFLFLCGALAMIGMSAAGGVAQGLFVFVLLGVAGWISWSASLMRVVLSPGGIDVRNVISSMTIPWTDVTGASACSAGVRISTAGGEVMARAVERQTLDKWRGSWSEADELAARITGRANGDTS